MVYDDLGRCTGYVPEESAEEKKKRRRKESIAGWKYIGWLVLLDIIVQMIFVKLSNDNKDFWISIGIALVMLGVTLPIVALILGKMGDFSNQFRLWKIKWIDWKGILTYFGIMIAGSVAFGLVSILTNGEKVTSANQQSLQDMATPTMLPGLLVLILIVGPIIEELIFRGAIMGYLLKERPAWVRISTSGVMFGLFHMIGTTSVLPFMQYMFMGIVLAFIFWRKGKIQMSIIVHFLNNLLAVVPLIMMALH